MPHVLNASRNGIISRSCERTLVRAVVGMRARETHHERADLRLIAAKAALRGEIRHDELSHIVSNGGTPRRVVAVQEPGKSTNYDGHCALRGWSESSLVTQSIPAAKRSHA